MHREVFTLMWWRSRHELAWVASLKFECY